MIWPFSLFKNNTDGPDAALFERYRQFREAGRGFNLTLAKQLPKPAVQECGKKLGLFKAGTLILNNEDEIAILYDYAFYHHRRADKNLIERVRENSPPEPDSVEAELLEAMAKSYYSLFRLEEIRPAKGAKLRDLLTDETLELMDKGLGDTGMPGLILAGRILPLSDFNLSSGTMIPLPEPVFQEKIAPIVEKFLNGKIPAPHPLLSAGQEAAFVAQIIRISLHAAGEDNVFYTDMEA